MGTDEENEHEDGERRIEVVCRRDDETGEVDDEADDQRAHHGAVDLADPSEYDSGEDHEEKRVTREGLELDRVEGKGDAAEAR